MAILDSPPVGNPPEIIGYVDPWIVNPGSTIDVKVSYSKKHDLGVSLSLNVAKFLLLSLARPFICF
jgi:hypothetical protein